MKRSELIDMAIDSATVTMGNHIGKVRLIRSDGAEMVVGDGCAWWTVPYPSTRKPKTMTFTAAAKELGLLQVQPKIFQLKERAQEIRNILWNAGVDGKDKEAARAQVYGVERCYYMCKKLRKVREENGGQVVADESFQHGSYTDMAHLHIVQLETILARIEPTPLDIARKLRDEAVKNAKRQPGRTPTADELRTAARMDRLHYVVRSLIRDDMPNTALEIVGIMEELSR